MTPIAKTTIKACPWIGAPGTGRAYVEEITAEHPELGKFAGALLDIVNTQNDDVVELFAIPDMDGDFVSSASGTLLLWMPDINRAALNCYQIGDWNWTDAHSPEDALRRYAEDEMTN